MGLTAGSRLGPYEIIASIGSGAMGDVYRAQDLRLGRTVALKVLPEGAARDPERHRLFEQEARAVAALNHPHICVLYDIGFDAGTEFLVMEYLDGQTLAEQLKKGPMPLERALEIGVQIVDALDKAHCMGIVHRDLKPGNVMLTQSGAKLLDFGLAELTAGTDNERTRAIPLADHAPARLVGTPSYMSPEQAKGLGPDHRSDIFSVGVVLYEMVTGRRPFQGDALASLLTSIAHDTPPPPTRLNPLLPLRLGRIIDRCLAKDPERRYQAVDDLRRHLEGLRSDLASAARAVDRSIAVLPFADMSPNRDQAYLCEGLAEEILIALTRVKGLRVATRPAAFRFRGSDDDPIEIGARLQVSTLLDGSVRKAGDRLRVTVKLVEVGDGFCLWSERYERDMRDVFAIQDEIARAVVAALDVTVSSSDWQASQRLAIADVEAFECYHRGRVFFGKFDKRGVAFARELFDRAIAIDPGFARAQAGLADCGCYLYLYAGRNQVDLDRAIEAARRALELDPRLAEAQASLGTALSLSGRHVEAEAAFQSAIHLDPRLFEAHYFYARDSFAEGKLELAIQEYEEASRVRPEDYQAPLLVAQIYDDLGHADAARASRLHGVAIAENRLKLNPDDVRALYMGANGLVALGERELGLQWARRAVELEPDDSMLLYNVACIFSLAGQTDDALDYIERAVAAGLTQRGWLEHDSNLDAIRSAPRFQNVLARLA